jgi:hypothetical protein
MPDIREVIGEGRESAASNTTGASGLGNGAASESCRARKTFGCRFGLLEPLHDPAVCGTTRTLLRRASDTALGQVVGEREDPGHR